MSLFNSLTDSLLGPCVRSAAGTDANRKLFLTFDDGPVAGSTEAVLDLLARHDAQASFFVIGQKARQMRCTVRRMQAEGHSVGDHSMDHTYRNFFAPLASIKSWIADSHDSLSDQLGERPVGFRSPAGVRTPKLHEALRQLGIPLVHWNTRFFESNRLWQRPAALQSLTTSQNGDIILLHDVRKGDLEAFLRTLEAYIVRARELGFQLARLPPLPLPPFQHGPLTQKRLPPSG